MFFDAALYNLLLNPPTPTLQQPFSTSYLNVLVMLNYIHFRSPSQKLQPKKGRTTDNVSPYQSVHVQRPHIDWNVLQRQRLVAVLDLLIH